MASLKEEGNLKMFIVLDIILVVVTISIPGIKRKAMVERRPCKLCKYILYLFLVILVYLKANLKLATIIWIIVTVRLLVVLLSRLVSMNIALLLSDLPLG